MAGLGFFSDAGSSAWGAQNFREILKDFLHRARMNSGETYPLADKSHKSTSRQNVEAVGHTGPMVSGFYRPFAQTLNKAAEVLHSDALKSANFLNPAAKGPTAERSHLQFASNGPLAGGQQSRAQKARPPRGILGHVRQNPPNVFRGCINLNRVDRLNRSLAHGLVVIVWLPLPDIPTRVRRDSLRKQGS